MDDKQDTSKAPMDSSEIQNDPDSNAVGQAQGVQKGINASFILSRVFAILLIISALVFSFFIGFYISFGACYKSSCSPVEAYAPFILPVLSLLITVPVAVGVFKKK